MNPDDNDSDEECRMSANVIAKIVLANPFARRDLFWVAVEKRLRDGPLDSEISSSLLRRFCKAIPIWLSNYLVRRHRLDRNCAELLVEFAGFGNGCQECGRYNELPNCTFCYSHLCKLHMKPCYICLQFNDDIFNDSSCSQCACVWCHKGVCPDHKVTCKCGNNIC